MKRYRYRLWCVDCFGVDYQGCFDGGYRISEESFNTPQEANKAAEAIIENVSTWYHDVIKEIFLLQTLDK